MGCFDSCFKECEFKRKQEKVKYFHTIKNGLKESMIDFKYTLDKINNWDELVELKDDEFEGNKLLKSATVKDEFKKDNLCCFYIFGFLFYIFQLIGIQGYIIILNSFFKEIVEEFKLLFKNEKGEHNFYDLVQINSYRELPEIDVAMITSSIGISFLKNFGFYCANITFQLITLIYFFLLFLLFKFHTGDQLQKNYMPIEFVTLILSYIFLSIFVGCSSTLALKEFSEVTNKVFSKADGEKNEEKEKKEDKGAIWDKLCFYIMSGLSALIIILVNRKIFTSFEDINNKWVLYLILIICAGCFVLNMIFYLLFSIPITNKKKKSKINIQKENLQKPYEAKEIEIEIVDISQNDIQKNNIEDNEKE